MPIYTRSALDDDDGKRTFILHTPLSSRIETKQITQQLNQKGNEFKDDELTALTSTSSSYVYGQYMMPLYARDPARMGIGLRNFLNFPNAKRLRTYEHGIRRIVA